MTSAELANCPNLKVTATISSWALSTQKAGSTIYTQAVAGKFYLHRKAKTTNQRTSELSGSNVCARLYQEHQKGNALNCSFSNNCCEMDTRFVSFVYSREPRYGGLQKTPSITRTSVASGPCCWFDIYLLACSCKSNNNSRADASKSPDKWQVNITARLNPTAMITSFRQVGCRSCGRCTRKKFSQ